MEKITPLNLIRQTNPEAPSSKPGFYKGIVFDILTVVAALITGYAYSGYLAGSFPFGLLFAAVAIFAVFSTLQAFFTRNSGRRFLIVLLEALAILFFFWGQDIKILAAALAVMTVLFFWGDLAGKRELENGLEIRFFAASRRVLTKFTTAVILAFIILYIPTWTPEKSFVSREAFDSFAGWMSNLVASFYPDIKLNSSFSELARGFAMTQLRDDKTFMDLAPAAREGVLAQATNQVAASLSKTLGVDVGTEAPVIGIFYEFFINLIRGWQEQFGSYFLAAWGLAVFLTARSFGVAFYWFFGILSFIVYQIFIAAGIVHIIGETRTHEVLEW